MHTHMHTCSHMHTHTYRESFPGGSVIKNPAASTGDAGDLGLIPGLGRCPGVGNGNPLQYSCLENHVDRGAWGAIVHRVAEVGPTEVGPKHAYI